ncbi:hypothetical protein ACFX1X_001313 [Malus domestica]
MPQIGKNHIFRSSNHLLKLSRSSVVFTRAAAWVSGGDLSGPREITVKVMKAVSLVVSIHEVRRTGPNVVIEASAAWLNGLAVNARAADVVNV